MFFYCKTGGVLDFNGRPTYFFEEVLSFMVFTSLFIVLTHISSSTHPVIHPGSHTVTYTPLNFPQHTPVHIHPHYTVTQQWNHPYHTCRHSSSTSHEHLPTYITNHRVIAPQQTPRRRCPFWSGFNAPSRNQRIRGCLTSVVMTSTRSSPSSRVPYSGASLLYR